MVQQATHQIYLKPQGNIFFAPSELKYQRTSQSKSFSFTRLSFYLLFMHPLGHDPLFKALLNKFFKPFFFSFFPFFVNLAATAKQLSLNMLVKMSLCFHPFFAHLNFLCLVNVCLLSFSTGHVVIPLFSPVFFCCQY